MIQTDSRADIRPVTQSGQLTLAIRRNGAHGQGTIVTAPGAPKLIAGVALQPLVIHPDDRGFFEEVFRSGQGLAKNFSPAQDLQVSAAFSYPGAIKAIHYHLRQTDLWTPVLGLLQVFLYDLRLDSPTFGETNTLYAGVLRPMQIQIPPGVGHGYKVAGPDPALLVYATDRFYDPADEGRIPWNDPDINYDWETQKK